ncbi:MAG: hypothetical protein H7Y30_15250 [Pyrinomonadaceae bacterium]|nr:hypothetical protein [Pyrinomonadaceae bacterium]
MNVAYEADHKTPFQIVCALQLGYSRVISLWTKQVTVNAIRQPHPRGQLLPRGNLGEVVGQKTSAKNKLVGNDRQSPINLVRKHYFQRRPPLISQQWARRVAYFVN